MNAATIKHELHHVLGSTYGIHTHALKYGESFKRLFDTTLVHIDLRGSVAQGVSGEVALHHPDLPQHVQLAINATGALTPAVMSDDEYPLREAFRTHSIAGLYASPELSAHDRALFDSAPADYMQVLEASLVAREYTALFGMKFHKFAKKLDAAHMSHDDLPLPAVVNYDRFTTAVRHLPELREYMCSGTRKPHIVGGEV